MRRRRRPMLLTKSRGRATLRLRPCRRTGRATDAWFADFESI